MTDRAQFEAMLEALINEDHEQAKEIFHNIVVGKSREIYEELLAEDFSPEEANKHAGLGGHQSENMEEEDDSMEEDMEEEGAEEEKGEDEPEDDGEDDGEEEPDFGGEDDGEEEPDFGGDEEGDEMGGDIEDRVMDLEDALEDLKAEFEQLMADEEHEPEHHDGIDDPAFGGMDAEQDEVAHMMEYVNKVALPKHGDNGQNTKSVIDNMKNDMGGTTANIAKNFSTTTGGTQGGLLKPSTTLQDGGNINKPGANAGKTAFKKKEPGHGPESKGKGESADNKKSTIGGRIR